MDTKKMEKIAKIDPRLFPIVTNRVCIARVLRLENPKGRIKSKPHES